MTPHPAHTHTAHLTSGSDRSAQDAATAVSAATPDVPVAVAGTTPGTGSDDPVATTSTHPSIPAPAARAVPATAMAATTSTPRAARWARWSAGARRALARSCLLAVVVLLAVELAWPIYLGAGPVLTALARSPHGAAAAVLDTGVGAVDVLAAPGDDPGAGITLDQFLSNVRLYVVGLLATLTIVFLSIGGIRLVIARGEPDEYEKGKAAIKSGVYGFLATVLAPAFVTVLQGLFRTGN